MSFSETAWESADAWFKAILDHPFVRALGDGTLAEDTFARYLVDDAHYLTGYARALATIAARAPDADGIELFAGAAVGAIAAERQTHAAFLAPRGIDLSSPDITEPSPTCRAYVGALEVAAAFAPVEVAIASVLPCFRVYAEVGRVLLATTPAADHPYRTWIDTYSAPAFDEAVRAVEAYTDRLAASARTETVAHMADGYLQAGRSEWMFWDAAWRAESWPTP